MLKFMRNKIVGIEVKDSNTVLAHGFLDDNIYSIEMNVLIDINHLEIRDIDGRWNRWTTTECKRAIPFLKEAIGLRMEGDFSQTVRKVIGRKACRHFANLLLECCYTAKQASEVLKDKFKEKHDVNNATPENNSDKNVTPITSADMPDHSDTPFHDKPVSFSMVIDLHMHSFPASPCSSVSVDQLIKEAKRIGLDAICLTDHNYVWDRDTVEDLRQKHGFLILRGNEITTDQGDMLVFGMEKDIKGIISLADLREEVLESRGIIIAAHPFRGFLTVGIQQIGLTLERAIKRPMFRYVDAIETLNGSVTENENRFTEKVAEKLGLPKTGGSDAHEVSRVGVYATGFVDRIKDEKDLIDAIKEGRCFPTVFRKHAGFR